MKIVQISTILCCCSLHITAPAICAIKDNVWATNPVLPSAAPFLLTDSSVVDQFTMTFNNSFLHSTPILSSEREYSMYITGTYALSLTSALDAGFYYCYYECLCCCDANTPCSSVIPDDRITHTLRPLPDTYHIGHAYYYSFTGADTAMVFAFEDCCYGDNSGALNITIYKLSTCEDGIMNGDESGIDCGGPDCAHCEQPVASCGVMYVHIDPNNPAYDGPGSQNVWLISASNLDAGSISYSMSPEMDVRRYLSNITFDWTTSGACIDITPNGGALSNADKGNAWRSCLPVIPGDFNKNKLYKLRIQDEFGSDECTGTIKIIPDLIDELRSPIVHLIFPDNNAKPSKTFSKDNPDDGIRDSNRALSVFPNPGTGVMHIRWKSFSYEPVLIKVLNLSGQCILSHSFDQEPGDNALTFNFDEHPEGIYIVQIISESIENLVWVKQ